MELGLRLKKMSKKEKERNFIENGGRMLEEFISSCDGRVNPIRIYSAAELEKAIGNTKPVLPDSDGNYYKGTYRGRTILIEFRFREQGCNYIFNEMAVLSQMKHRNAVKLLGCCLETKVPMLVYVFASNGILSDHIKDLSWEDRLRIAAQVAEALTYMHTATGKGLLKRREREQRFIENGAQLLEELISSCDGKVKSIRIFSVVELEKAIVKEKVILYEDDTHTYYRGTRRGHTIVIKKQSEQLSHHIFNEITVLSQINHKNVVKLLGCCLETKPPLLVYEFVSNGSLSHHIYYMDKRSLSWEDCLRIASEVADALTYLHKATPRPIIHRDIKPSSILLDEHFSAKVAELGLAVSIPLGETRVELEKIEGTYGYADPEYLSTGKLTEKSDVYSFGELLLDLLTGKKAYDRKKTGDGGAAFSDLVISSMKEEWLGLDSEASIESDKKMEQLIAWVELALSCVKPKGEERPTMKEVAQELRRIKGAKNYLWGLSKENRYRTKVLRQRSSAVARPNLFVRWQSKPFQDLL